MQFQWKSAYGTYTIEHPLMTSVSERFGRIRPNVALFDADEIQSMVTTHAQLDDFYRWLESAVYPALGDGTIHVNGAFDTSTHIGRILHEYFTSLLSTATDAQEPSSQSIPPFHVHDHIKVRFADGSRAEGHIIACSGKHYVLNDVTWITDGELHFNGRETIFVNTDSTGISYMAKIADAPSTQEQQSHTVHVSCDDRPEEIIDRFCQILRQIPGVTVTQTPTTTPVETLTIRWED